MVTIEPDTTDMATAWRVRDRLATHPLLSGATAEISVTVHGGVIVLRGWALDQRICDTASRLAAGAAGRRPVDGQLSRHRS